MRKLTAKPYKSTLGEGMFTTPPKRKKHRHYFYRCALGEHCLRTVGINCRKEKIYCKCGKRKPRKP